MTESVQFQWKPIPKFLLLVCAVLPLTFAAGFWQLDRAEQKRVALEQQDRGAAQPAVDLTTLDENELQNYTKVFIRGEWSDELFLLDNRIRSGRVGYEVVGVIRVNGLKPVLVNRGWVDGGQDRSVMPKIERTFGMHQVEGYLYKATQKPIVLAEQLWSGSYPERLQVIDFGLLEKRLEESLYPSVLRISSESPLAFRADWVIERKGPGMHIGYAVQWFLMAITVFIMTIFANSNLWKWLQYKRAQKSNRAIDEQ